MAWTNDDQRRLMACRGAVLVALEAKAKHREENPSVWQDAEIKAMADAANAWARANGGGWAVTDEDVRRADQMAMGHSDYSTKVSLYVAEMVMGVFGGPR